MEKDQIVILKDRGLISVSGKDSKYYYQCTIFSGIFTPQGKYLFEFFITKSGNSFLLDCDIKIVKK